MKLISLEHGRTAYRADFAFYGAAVLIVAATLLIACPRGQRLESAALAGLGLAGWSLIEYLLHRFVLHVVPPFCEWHARHHRRPTALISTPTLLSAALIVALVFAPACALIGLWPATALTWGVLTGYLAYAIVHHAMHHWHTGNAWVRRRKRWHALHHGQAVRGSCYGVTSGLWDHVFGSTPESGVGLSAAAASAGLRR